MQNFKEREHLSPSITDKLTERRVEVGGITVKCVVSNIRRPDVPWNSYQLVYGTGREGNLVVEAKTSYGFRVEVESQKDIQDLDLLSAGGVVGIKSGVPGRGQELLVLKPLGLVAENGRPVDLIELNGGHHETLDPSAPIIMICGTSAEVGKTTTSVGLIRALSSEGLQVAATKFS